MKLHESPTWPYVLAFALEMEKKLAANRHKGDRSGWLNMDPDDLLHMAHDELEELSGAAIEFDLGSKSSDDVWGEAADVANFAMMVADAATSRGQNVN